MFEDVPEIAGKYDSFVQLGEGGMGTIFRARHKFLDEVRVIKAIRGDQELNDAQERFLREARIAARLRHPNIAAVHDFILGPLGGAFIVMEYLEGVNLWEVYREQERLPPREVGRLAQQVLDALDYLHGQRFIHRDIALDNIMMTRDQRGHSAYKLIDLGIAKSLESHDYKTATGIALGKVLYISPEALKYGSGAKQIDHRSDLYSFGVVLYQLLTGTLPIQGSDQTSLIAGHLYHEPKSFADTDPDHRLPAPLRTVLLRAIAKDPEQRFPTARLLQRELKQVLPPSDDLETEQFVLRATTRFSAKVAERGPPKTTASRSKTARGPRDPRPAPRVAAPAATLRGALSRRLFVAGAAVAAAAVAALVVPAVRSRALPGPAAGAAGASSPAAVAAATPSGTFYALVIGNNQYRHMPRLETAIQDARAVAAVLAGRYGFHVTTLENADRADVFVALDGLRARLTARDSLVLYYAGHGNMIDGREYWQPVDAEPGDTTNWLSTEHDISAQLDELPVKHLLVVADSCYAGSQQAPLEPATEPMVELLQRTSRLVMTSGTQEPVLDDDGGRHSVFARYLVAALEGNDRALQAAELFADVRRKLEERGAVAGLTQTPTFAPIPNSRDSGGMFFFVPRGAARAS